MPVMTNQSKCSNEKTKGLFVWHGIFRSLEVHDITTLIQKEENGRGLFECRCTIYILWKHFNSAI